MSDLVHIENNQVFTTSLQIATTFGKEHKNVLRDISNLTKDLPQDFNTLNFEPVNYFDKKGEERTYYNITRDGFSLLCMGFTGAKALQFKLAYINAFNEMESFVTVEHQKLANQNQALKDEILKARPMWHDIIRYKQLGLSTAEIARFTKRAKSTICNHVRTMQQLGYGIANEPQPAQLAFALEV